MHSQASLKNHPIHPMLVVFPIGLWVFSLIADLIYRFGDGSSSWNLVAYYSLGGGIVGALLAAIPGLIDLMGIHETRAKRIGIAHMVINLIAVALYAVNFYLRSQERHNPTIPVALSVIGVGLLSISGWLGGELVYVYRVAVEDREPIKHGPRS